MVSLAGFESDLINYAGKVGVIVIVCTQLSNEKHFGFLFIIFDF